MGGVFPGAPTLDVFWQAILAGRDSVAQPAPERWPIPAEQCYSEVVAPDKVSSRRACLIRDRIAVPFAGPPLDTALIAGLDPMYSMLLHAGYAAWQDCRHDQIEPSRAGVIVGNIVLPTEQSSLYSSCILDPRVAASIPVPHPLNRHVAGLPAGLLAQALGLGACSWTLDAACASSLYAVYHAVSMLADGRADLVLSGGLARPDCLYTQMGFSQLQALSRRGQCRPFDHLADGLVVGEGCGMLALKRLDDAIADGDHIYATIAGCGLSNDIKGSLMQPDAEGQLRAMQAAYQQAEWTPDMVQHIECHGTGTPLGDAVEFAALMRLWADVGGGQAVIGSVKGNVGHLLTAAGAAALIKSSLALHKQWLPPTAHFECPAPGINLADSPFEILRAPEKWQAVDGAPRRAAVSGFGFGGINAHILLQEYLQPPATGHFPPPIVPPAPAVAIVGVAARVGSARTVPELLQILLHQQPASAAPSVQACGALHIPVDRYPVPPKELQEALPQQLLMLDMACEAMSDAQLSDLDESARLRTGVYIGIGLDMNACNFHLRWLHRYQVVPDCATELPGPPLNAGRTMGALGSIVASRIARALSLGGPAFTVSSEETSGLVALRLAVKALQVGDLDRVIVGAVDLPSDPRARGGRDGQTSGESEGMVYDAAIAFVLQRATDVRPAGQSLYALVRGIGQQSGEAVPAMTPQGATQAIQSACVEADIPVQEQDGLESVVLPGYAGAATALLGCLRAVLALRHRLLPATQKRKVCYWLHDRADGPRRALLSVGSLAGDTVALILQEAEAAVSVPSPHCFSASLPPRLFLLQAANTAMLSRQLDTLNFSTSPAVACPAGPSRTRAALLVDNETALHAAAARLRSAMDTGRPLHTPQAMYVPEPFAEDELAFVFPGFGNHFPGMGRVLGTAFPAILECQHQESRYLGQQFGGQRVWQTDNEIPLQERDVLFAQVALGSFVSDVLADCAVRPQAVIGYSLGETVSLVATRAWSQRDEILQRIRSSHLFVDELSGVCRAAAHTWGSDAPVSWLTGVVRSDVERLQDCLAEFPRVYLLIINAPGECVIGGDKDDVLRCVARLGTVLRHAVPGTVTVHCEVVARCREAYRALHLFPTKAASGVRYYSGAWASAYQPDRDRTADSILAGALHTIDYTRLIKTSWQDGVRLFVEMGPGASCTRMIRRILAGRPHLALSVCTAGGDDLQSLLATLGMLHCHGRDIDTSKLDTLFPAPTATAGHTVTVSAPILRLPPRYRPSATVQQPMPATPPPRAPCTEDTLTHHHDTQRLQVPDSLPRHPVLAQMQATATACADTQASFLRLQSGLTQSLSECQRWQEGQHRALPMSLPAVLGGSGNAVVAPVAEPHPDTGLAPLPWHRSQCLEFALGRASSLFGPRFADVDRYPVRVRLPAEPLMLVDRVLHIEGTLDALCRDLPHCGGIVTEHEVGSGAWYLDGGRIPVCIAVEAGQADLLLSSYLGIDHLIKGEAVYRLLDAKIEFQDRLPRPGDVIRYAIHIERFFRQGETWLFRFRFDAAVDGRVVLRMREGCAGFFTAQALEAGRGIVSGVLPPSGGDAVLPITETTMPLSSIGPGSLGEAQLDALRAGNPGACFGGDFAALPASCVVWPSSKRMRLIHRILWWHPHGGYYGKGYIKGESDIRAQDWFLRCHFVDDQVMPGTLMYESCLHTLRVFLSGIGWIDLEAQCIYEPVCGIASRLKCRGQVTAQTRTVQYEITIKTLGYQEDGTPSVLADALMYADHRPIVQIQDMSLQLSGLHRDALLAAWAGQGTRPYAPRRTILFDNASILAFATGNPSQAFGSRYRVFDQKRRIARLPRPPYKFLDRVMSIAGCTQWQMRPGGWIETEYDVPSDAWYFAADRQPRMPFAILLEVALQPCGWFAAYLGSALQSEEDLSFRNLGGNAMQHRSVAPDVGTLYVLVRLVRVSHSGGMIIQHYEYAVCDRQGLVYIGDTYFGFFPEQALSRQLGIEGVRLYQPGPDECIRATQDMYPVAAPFPDDMLRMVDELHHFDPDGGRHRLGFIRGRTRVRPDAWFFTAHFHQDPVWPGSLGLESLLQLLKVYACKRFPWRVSRFQCMALGHRHSWTYRGQIVPTDGVVDIEATITAVDDRTGWVQADGLLSVDDRVIYRMEDFALSCRSE